MLRSGQIMILVLCLFYNQVQDDMDDLKRKEQCSRHCSESCMERVIKSMAPFHRTVLCNKVLLHKSLFSKLNKVEKGCSIAGFVILGYITPGGRLMVLKEAVDYAEEESKARKTETENICHLIIAQRNQSRSSLFSFILQNILLLLRKI